ncbi:response regulator [uncultured Magnetospirillum sp.]|uniref:response regulator transcription factor n=1 Tax=uncultured Magnetospirillum sp. TaxID=354119 RepID=UPI00262E84C5|nr:response regulator [uncultured Magnetospirillum sp.]
MQQEPPFVVAIVDDDAGFRDAIGWLLKANGYGVRGYADAPSFLAGHDPTVIGCVLLDLRLDDSCGIDTLVEARRRGLDAPVLMISGHGDIPTAVKAVKLGAAGFIEKPVDNELLLRSVADACHLHLELRSRYGMATEAIGRYQLLTAREKQIFWLLVEGRSTKECATTLGLSARTVEIHRSHLGDKLRAWTPSERLRIAWHAKALACHQTADTGST